MMQFNLNIFKRVFAQTTNDFSVAGSRLMNDGSGETNFRAALFQDNMNGAAINIHNWRVTEIGGAHAHPNASKGIKFFLTAINTGDYASIKLKGSYGKINETGYIKFTLQIKGITAGGTGIYHDDTTTGEAQLWGMYADDDNYVCIRVKNELALATNYKLVTRLNGTETESAAFTIPGEDAANIKIDIIMSTDNAEAYKDDVLVAQNTTNVPNNAELRPFVRLTCGAGLSIDNFIYVDYIRIEQ